MCECRSYSQLQKHEQNELNKEILFEILNNQKKSKWIVYIFELKIAIIIKWCSYISRPYLLYTREVIQKKWEVLHLEKVHIICIIRGRNTWTKISKHCIPRVSEILSGRWLWFLQPQYYDTRCTVYSKMVNFFLWNGRNIYFFIKSNA